MRIVFTLLVASLLSTPFLKIIGSLLLLWIAVKLLVEDEEEADDGDEEEEGDKEDEVPPPLTLMQQLEPMIATAPALWTDSRP